MLNASIRMNRRRAFQMSKTKRPRPISGPLLFLSGSLLFLVPLVDDGLAAGSIIIILLDDGSTLGRLALLDYRAIPIPITITMALADADASPDRSNVNADVISQRGCSKRRDGGNYQYELH
jgi:hypothetical protein